MSQDLIEQLEEFRLQNSLTYAQLAHQLEIPETYLYRWRKKKGVSGIYARFIKMFLER